MSNSPNYSHIDDSLIINSDPLTAMQEVIKSGGIVSIQKGLIFTLMRDMPGYCGYFWSYFYMQPAFVEYLGISSFTSSFFAGGFAGSILWLLALPGDTMKSRYQTGMG